MWISGITNPENYELDELYWFVEQKTQKETRENIYLVTMISREPRQIVGFSVATDKSPKRIQTIVDSAPDAEKYCTDGYLGYVDVIYPGEHIRNISNKNDTFTVEGINADILIFLFLHVETGVLHERLKHWKLFFQYLLMLTINLGKQSLGIVYPLYTNHKILINIFTNIEICRFLFWTSYNNAMRTLPRYGNT